jgi:hypothetical protein
MEDSTPFEGGGMLLTFYLEKWPTADVLIPLYKSKTMA